MFYSSAAARSLFIPDMASLLCKLSVCLNCFRSCDSVDHSVLILSSVQRLPAFCIKLIRFVMSFVVNSQMNIFNINFCCDFDFFGKLYWRFLFCSYSVCRPPIQGSINTERKQKRKRHRFKKIQMIQVF